MPALPRQQQIVIIGSGFAGVHAARSLSRLARHLPGDAAGIEIVLINSSGYFLYLPLLPEVTAGSWTRAGSRPPVVAESVSPGPVRHGAAGRQPHT